MADNMKREEKIMVVSGCSKSKLSMGENIPVMAKKLYTGQLFQGVRKFAELHQYDFYCMSGKYGLIPGDREIKTYNQKIKTSEDSNNLHPLIMEQTNHGALFQSYDYILLVMGREYKAVFGEWLNDSSKDPINPITNPQNPITKKFISIEDKRGLFGYKQIVASLLKIKYDCFKSLFDNETRVLSMESLNKSMNKSKISSDFQNQCGIDELLPKLVSDKMEGIQ